MLNVVEPQFSGIGGGGFMMVHLARHDHTFAIDGRERAPAAASPRMFLFTGVSPANLFGLASTSGISVGVPGTLAVLDTALKRYGTISLAQALQPAIAIADNGFRINRFLAANIANDGGITSLQPEIRTVFRPGGGPLADGDLLVQKDLAKTFRLIAQQGADVFYHGEIAKAIVNAQKRSRSPVAAEGMGRMELSDLAAYRTEIRQPITGNYCGYRLASMSPPSSGGLTIIQMLKMLERFPLGDTAQGYGFGATKTMFNFTPTFDAATGNPGANDVAPFKRPRSSMSPTIVFRKGEPVAAYGSPGGSTIINSVLNTTLNLVDHRMTIQQAIDAPRLSVTSAAGGVSCEGGQPFMLPAFSQATLDALRFTLLHPVPLVPTVGGVPTCASSIGSVQGIVIDLKTDRQFGGADQRREGTVIGITRRRDDDDDDD